MSSCAASCCICSPKGSCASVTSASWPTANLPVSKRDQTVVGDGHAMGAAAQVLEHKVWATEGWFKIDDPFFSVQGSQPGGKDLRLGEECEVTVEADERLESLCPCGSPDKQMTMPSATDSSKPTPKKQVEFRIYLVSKARSGYRPRETSRSVLQPPTSGQRISRLSPALKQTS